MKPDSVAPAVDPLVVADHERRLGLRLDPDYLAFLQQHNGGVPEECLFLIDAWERMVDRFLCVVDFTAPDDEFGDYDVEVNHDYIWDRLNGYQMPFAVLFAGDFLLFDYTGPDEEEPSYPPRVTLWLHEESRDDHPVTLPVAPNFLTFLDMLYKPDESE